MGERVFKTLNQQLDILVTRGVNIKDEDFHETGISDDACAVGSIRS